VKATTVITRDQGWTYAVRFSEEMTPNVEAYSSQLEVEWNCRRNILYLRPRAHNTVLSKGQFIRARVLFTNISEVEMKSKLVREAKNQSLMWFNSHRGGKDANCLHYDFEYGVPFCDDEVTTTSTTRPPTTRPPTTATTDGGKSGVVCTGQTCELTLPDGSVIVGKHIGGVVEFRGIPYAEAPVGNLRWKPPMVRTSYGGDTIDATNFANGCAGNNWDGTNDDEKMGFSEDCLVVNISVERSVLEGGQKVPIVYYIHGGGFNSGSNRINMKNLILEQGVMVISIAYRLGIYGFLYLPEAEAGAAYNGNWGLLDQNAALEWSQTFAPYFGGDISQATLNGCSAGSESIWWHLTMEKSWPYFQRAVTVGIGLNSAYDTTLGAG